MVFGVEIYLLTITKQKLIQAADLLQKDTEGEQNRTQYQTIHGQMRIHKDVDYKGTLKKDNEEHTGWLGKETGVTGAGNMNESRKIQGSKDTKHTAPHKELFWSNCKNQIMCIVMLLLRACVVNEHQLPTPNLSQISVKFNEVLSVFF